MGEVTPQRDLYAAFAAASAAAAAADTSSPEAPHPDAVVVATGLEIAHLLGRLSAAERRELLISYATTLMSPNEDAKRKRPDGDPSFAPMED